eukprot:gnl/TRDRNA2_/TRDRNA2_92388_c0_seq1.p1 gnl/TRDRNA2_/TRDRNA2_92388_c0~~gnl/TRDRNA2_/TRDRNA2_92388_c0_seq1.p1  ORF type:complete len:207 (+),score=22.33 gnl/TRDRNA2_/TRDRNA2_92388_c0_seq1:519-1139(+)
MSRTTWTAIERETVAIEILRLSERELAARERSGSPTAPEPSIVDPAIEQSAASISGAVVTARESAVTSRLSAVVRRAASAAGIASPTHGPVRNALLSTGRRWSFVSRRWSLPAFRPSASTDPEAELPWRPSSEAERHDDEDSVDSRFSLDGVGPPGEPNSPVQDVCFNPNWPQLMRAYRAAARSRRPLSRASAWRSRSLDVAGLPP